MRAYALCGMAWALPRLSLLAAGGIALCSQQQRCASSQPSVEPAAATQATDVDATARRWRTHQLAGAERDPVTLYQSMPAQGVDAQLADVSTHFIYSKITEGEIEEFRLFLDGSADSLSALVRFGKGLTGVPGYVHGGLTASICDELFGCITRLREPNASAGTFFTARLEVDYRAPVPSGTTTIVQVLTEPMDGRKLWMTARMVDADSGALLVEAKSLFVLAKPR